MSSLINLFLEQFIERPLAAFIFGVEVLGQGLSAGQTVDGVISRLVHNLSCTQELGGEPDDDTTGSHEVSTSEPRSRRVWK